MSLEMKSRKKKPVSMRAQDCLPWEHSDATRHLLRSLIVIRPREPFMEWVRALSPDFKDVTLEHGRREGASAFLVPVSLEPEETEEFFQAHWQRFFAQALCRLEPDPTRWPQRLSLEMMREWFDVEMCCEVDDLCDDDAADDVAVLKALKTLMQE